MKCVLTVTSLLLAPLACSEREPSRATEHGGAGHPAPPTSPLATTVPPPAPVASPPPAAPLAASAGGSSGANGPLAVVIMMLPNLKDDPAHPGARTYKLSLTADTETATIEVDGQPVGTTHVQKVYPSARDRTAVGISSDGLVTREDPLPRAAGDVAEGRPRAPRRAAGPSPLAVDTHQTKLNPNGAPIID